jgi:small subunit ribosomal protein S4
MGIANTRRGARQLVGHRHVTVNGKVVNIPSYTLKPGDVVAVRGRSKALEIITSNVGAKTSNVRQFGWIEWNPDQMKGVFLAYPQRDQIPEKINEQLIVELYSK